MAYNNNNYGSGNKSSRNLIGDSADSIISEEMSAEDYAIIAAGLTALGEIFAFLSLVKAKQVIAEAGGEVGVDPVLFVQSRKKSAKRKSRPPR